MNKIKVLDKTISNMIAAGEVVERPASVVKELLENSIDAGAKNITVEIKSGGIKYIRVADDGIGMSKEDASISLLRHATSKIKDASDLEAINTLGFRGEALASISAVSNMDIYTKPHEAELGTYIKSSCGEIEDIQEAGCPVGTTIIVRDLFVNTPARMKFLKKDYTEAGYIADIIERLALAKPDISFRFINNDKEQLFTTGDASLLNAVFSVYGKDLKNAMNEASFSDNGVSAEGFCADPSFSRPNRNMQNFFVNGRYIKSPMMSRAVEEAYKQEIMTGKFPVCVLNITLDPHYVDINVHPTKLEAKFSDDRAVYHVVYWAVKNALMQKKAIPKAENKNPFAWKAEKDIKETEYIKKAPENENILSAEKIQEKILERLRTIEPKENKEESKKSEFVATEMPSFSVAESTVAEIKHESTPISEFKKIKEFFTQNSDADKKESIEENAAQEKKEEDYVLAPFTKEADYKICGQVFNTYIILEKDGQMLMLDQHAAHERLRFEELKKRYAERTIVSQPLLVPAVIDLTPREMAEFCEYKDEINALGFSAEPFGENDIIIRSTPTDVNTNDIKALIIKIIDLFSMHHKNIDEKIAQDMLYQIACKGAVKANMSLSEAEMRTLCDKIFALPNINTCPHGRPITIAFTKEFIEKQFKRIV